MVALAAERKGTHRLPRLRWWWLILDLILLAAVLEYPTRDTELRLITFVLGITTCGLLFVLLPKGWARGVLVLVGVLVLGFLFAPGRPVNAATLQQETVTSLLGYQGTPFVWGGESRFGVDCSGLVRMGRIWAELKLGTRTANPALVRHGLWLWWRDCSAAQLGTGSYHFTRLLRREQSINQGSDADLLPGDLGVLADGIHVVAYLGGHRWIEADPGLEKVVVVGIPDKTNAWFNQSVRLVRWINPGEG